MSLYGSWGQGSLIQFLALNLVPRTYGITLYVIEWQGVELNGWSIFIEMERSIMCKSIVPVKYCSNRVTDY
jgi:hypothetical protein